MSLFGKSARKTEHETIEEQLSAYLDGELTAQEQGLVERHLATCESCRWNLDTLRQTVQWTAELPTVQVPRVFTIPVPAQPERAPRWRWSLPLLQGATVLAALLLFFAVAGDFMLGAMLPGRSSEPRLMMEQDVASVDATEAVAKAVVEEVVVERKATEEPVAVAVEAPPEAEKVEAAPSPQSTIAVEKEAVVASTATDENSAMGGIGFESPPGAQDAVTETEGAGEARIAAPEATLTEAAYAAGGAQVTATMPPTVAPTTTRPPTASPAPPPTIARPTVLAEAPPEAVVAPQRGEGAETWQGPVAAGLDVAKVVLLVALVVLATSTAVVMARRRRVG